MVEQILFDGPTSNAVTLEGYYKECSRGKSFLNRSNSKVRGREVTQREESEGYRYQIVCAYYLQPFLMWLVPIITVV